MSNNFIIGTRASCIPLPPLYHLFAYFRQRSIMITACRSKGTNTHISYGIGYFQRSDAGYARIESESKRWFLTWLVGNQEIYCGTKRISVGFWGDWSRTKKNMGWRKFQRWVFDVIGQELRNVCWTKRLSILVEAGQMCNTYTCTMW